MIALVVLITWMSCTSLGINVEALIKEIYWASCVRLLWNCWLSIWDIYYKNIFTFEAAVELKTLSADNGSLISFVFSASSTCAFFLLDWVLTEPVELLMDFLFVVMESCWTTFSNILGGKTISKLIKTILVRGYKNSENFLPLHW